MRGAVWCLEGCFLPLGADRALRMEPMAMAQEPHVYQSTRHIGGVGPHLKRPLALRSFKSGG